MREFNNKSRRRLLETLKSPELANHDHADFCISFAVFNRRSFEASFEPTTKSLMQQRQASGSDMTGIMSNFLFWRYENSCPWWSPGNCYLTLVTLFVLLLFCIATIRATIRRCRYAVVRRKVKGGDVRPIHSLHDHLPLGIRIIVVAMATILNVGEDVSAVIGAPSIGKVATALSRDEASHTNKCCCKTSTSSIVCSGRISTAPRGATVMVNRRHPLLWCMVPSKQTPAVLLFYESGVGVAAACVAARSWIRTYRVRVLVRGST